MEKCFLFDERCQIGPFECGRSCVTFQVSVGRVVHLIHAAYGLEMWKIQYLKEMLKFSLEMLPAVRVNEKPWSMEEGVFFFHPLGNFSHSPFPCIHWNFKNKSVHTPMVYGTYLVHVWHSMPAVRQHTAHTKARSSEITLKHEVTLANQRPEEKWKWPNYSADLLNDDNDDAAPIERVATGGCKNLKSYLWHLVTIAVKQTRSCTGLWENI